MAQNGPHGHQVSAAAASDDGHTAPPTTVTFSLMASAAGPYGNGGSSASNMGKNLIPDLNMEERDDSADGSRNKPHSEAVVLEVAAADADADADKGKSDAIADDGREPNVNINLVRERRKRMKGLFRALQDVMTHVPHKTDKMTLLGEAIQYIKFLQEKAAMLGKEELQEALALAREDAAARGEASSCYFSPDVPRAAPEAPAVPAPPIRFNTWTAPNVVLTVDNNNAYISVYGPRRAKNLSMVMFVLDNHGIDVITVQISADSASALVLIFAHVNGTDEANRSSEEVYQRVVAEITYRLHSRSN